MYDSAKGEAVTLKPKEIGLGAGSFDDLLPVPDIDATADHFLALISGDGPPAALESIRLNAAAMAINGEVAKDWPEALQLAADAMSSGEAVRVIERLKASAEAGSGSRA